MRPSVKKLFAATLSSCALVSPNFTPRAQVTQQPSTRPRRATTETWPATPTPDASINTLGDDADQTPRITTEPLVRIGLAVNARSVTVSTTGKLLDASASASEPVPFEVARVRIEPRTLPPLPVPTPIDADSDTRRVETASAPSSKAPNPSNSSPSTQPDSSISRGSVQLTSRASQPARGEVLYAPGSTRPLLDARAPVVFASDDEAANPVRFNERAYRGRLEVFANSHGTLTVVNVVALEDYVRGVVPNELSPGGWPELEALKAQAVAARTYAVSNIGRFSTEGFDLTSDTRSQVYGGRSTEHPLTDRAVFETRGRIATYHGQPINALYTSTCGGRTEDAENIFGGDAVPYLRGRECALESKQPFVSFTARTTRELPNVKLSEHASSARDAAILSVHGFNTPARLNDDWLAAAVTVDELRDLLIKLASLARQPAPLITSDSTRPGGFATALAYALDGESRGTTLLNSADVEYLLSFRDASDVPQQNRADVAAMLREGHVSLFPDGTLRPRLAVSRARALRSIAHALEARNLARLQKASVQRAAKDSLSLRPAQGRGETNLKFAPDAFLFSAFGEELFAVREINFVGGESLAYHTNARGEIDYAESRPSANGAATDHYSPFANWTETLTPDGVLSRLGRSVAGVGTILDLRVRRRGVSGRVLDMEVVGTEGTTHLRGGRIRSALGLREQLFVIDRTFDDVGRVTRFKFTGRGWGHGVGMCQVGAYGLARAGLSYEKILKSFYTGISVSKLY